MWARTIGFRILIPAGLILAGLSGCDKSPSKPAEPATPVTVAFTGQPQSALVHVALAKGFFAEEGLDFHPKRFTYGKAALQALLDGQSEIATAAETPIMFSILKGEKILVAANIVESNSNNGVVARTDAGITRLSDLRGKRVGFTSGTTSDFFLASLLNGQGMSRKDIREVPLKPEEMKDAILSNEVDAVSTWNYTLSEIKAALGPQGVLFLDREIYTETYNIVVTEAFAKAHPEVVEKFLRALILAEEFCRTHPDEAQGIMAAATNTDRNLVRDVWSNFQFHVGLDEITLITLEDETRWAIANKLTGSTGMPDYLSHMYFDGLKAVRPNSVRIGR